MSVKPLDQQNTIYHDYNFKQIELMTSLTILMLIACLLTLTLAQQDQQKSPDITMSQAWGFAFLTNLAMSILGLLAALLIVAVTKCISQSSLKIFTNMLYSLGCGAMIGDAMIHILPEAYKSTEVDLKFVSLVFICSICFFIILQRLFVLCGLSHRHWGDEGHQHGQQAKIQNSSGLQNKNQLQHQHQHQHQHQKCQKPQQIEGKNNQDKQNSNQKKPKLSGKFNLKRFKLKPIQSPDILKSPVEHQLKNTPIQQIIGVANVNSEEIQQKTQEEESCWKRFKGKGPAGYLNIMSSFIHNFFDGFAIGAAFASMDKTQYIPVVIAMFAHEIPREMGDVGILIKNKFNIIQTILCNVIVNLTSLIGALVGVGLGSISDSVQIYVLAFVAGNFIYIGADIWRNIFKTNKALNNILEFLSFALGVGTMYLVLLAESEEQH